MDALVAQNIQWPVKYDDMFPYADMAEDYWTGYFTSRANAKGYIRTGQYVLHAANKLLMRRMIDTNATPIEVAQYLDAKETLMEVMGIMQHHDAITGTAKQYVADDYNKMLHEAIDRMNTQYSNVAGLVSPNY